MPCDPRRVKPGVYKRELRDDQTADNFPLVNVAPLLPDASPLAP